MNHPEDKSTGDNAANRNTGTVPRKRRPHERIDPTLMARGAYVPILGEGLF